ncbi:hypothetical protein TVAG_360780 [Trichomonas vaginalis G3]|uniref:Uncharacterized protein n=1 Tax=Trichomonas vaginalis (strain ATCC PRA-98 / G3) TaxID=412133 RepID=A2FGN6_TRIV3|nr:quinoprotein alcohol dehydrogenase-like family [Trichomonas vaginalis G3]EAX95918.1 hypothetical protein TVAG_360780 [Trichomonas vaginalis G3]KAI5540151.1 quinoprotein alcohol dehydrogenase-like family [Trichomonas vaginalis G3]|eukprot:XP_001308848.1 hypothetical protein [Trichomonas vaginalis G3]
MERQRVRFGIFDDFEPQIGRIKTHVVHYLSNGQYLATTSKYIYRFNKKEIIKVYPFKCTTSVIIPEIDVVIGFLQNSSSLFGFEIFAPDPKRFVLKQTDPKQTIVFHLVYSPKSHLLFSIGFGIKVYIINSTKWSNNSTSIPPEMTLTFVSQFANGLNASIKNKPAFDYENEWVIIPTERGLCAYDMYGHQVCQVTKSRPYLFQNIIKDKSMIERLTCFTMIKTVSHKKSDQQEDCIIYKTKIATSDPQNGLCIWDGNSTVIKRLRTLNTSVVSVSFLDKQNLIYLDSYGAISLCNIVTGRSFNVYITQKMPNNMFVLKTEENFKLAISYELELQILDVLLPWNSFALNIPTANTISRSFKLDFPPRILISSGNSFIKLYSANNGKQLSAACPSSLSLPVYSLYDRGLIVDYHYNHDFNNYTLKFIDISNQDYIDQIFVILEDGSLVIFKTDDQIGEQMFEKRMGVKSISYVYYKNGWDFVLISKQDEIIIMDYMTFEQKVRFYPVKGRIISVHYHIHSNKVIVLYEKDIISFDVERWSIECRKSVKCTNVNALFDDTVYIGYKNGQILWIKIENDGNLVLPSDDDITIPHSSEVTDFAFSFNVWMSSSLDHNINIWDYNNNVISTINLPTPIYSCEFISSNLDILVGTDLEIMKIPGYKVFDSKYYENIYSEIDNSNELNEQSEEEMIIRSTLNQSMRSLRKTQNNVVQSQEEENNEEEKSESKVKPKIILDENQRATILTEMSVMTNNASTKQIADIIKEGNEENNKNPKKNEKIIEEKPQNSVVNPRNKKQKRVLSTLEIIQSGLEAEKKLERRKKRKSREKREKSPEKDKHEEEMEENLNVDNLFSDDEKDQEKIIRIPKKNSKIEYKPVKCINEEDSEQQNRPRRKKNPKSSFATKKKFENSSQISKSSISVVKKHGNNSSLQQEKPNSMLRNQSSRRIDSKLRNRNIIRPSMSASEFSSSILTSSESSASSSRLSLSSSCFSSSTENILSPRQSIYKRSRRFSTSDTHIKLANSKEINFSCDDIILDSPLSIILPFEEEKTPTEPQFITSKAPRRLMASNSMNSSDLESPIIEISSEYNFIRAPDEKHSAESSPRTKIQSRTQRFSNSLPDKSQNFNFENYQEFNGLRNYRNLNSLQIYQNEKQKFSLQISKSNDIDYDYETKIRNFQEKFRKIDPRLSYVFSQNNIRIERRSVTPPPIRRNSTPEAKSNSNSLNQTQKVVPQERNIQLFINLYSDIDSKQCFAVNEDCLLKEFGKGHKFLNKFVEFLVEIENSERQNRNQEIFRNSKYKGYVPYWSSVALNHKTSTNSLMKNKKLEREIVSNLVSDSPYFRIEPTVRTILKSKITNKINKLRLNFINIDSKVFH